MCFILQEAILGYIEHFLGYVPQFLGNSLMFSHEILCISSSLHSDGHYEKKIFGSCATCRLFWLCFSVQNGSVLFSCNFSRIFYYSGRLRMKKTSIASCCLLLGTIFRYFRPILSISPCQNVQYQRPIWNQNVYKTKNRLQSPAPTQIQIWFQVFHDGGPYHVETGRSIDLLYKSMDWFLYDRDFRH